MAALAIAACSSLVVQAAVSDTLSTDVTTRAFSVAWVSDETVTTATVRVFADSGGVTELTSGLNVSLTSPAAALGVGVVRVDVTGLTPDTCYYYQTETTGTGTVQFPAAPPFIEVCTEIAARKVNALDGPIVNDLIRHELYLPDGVTPAPGSLMVLSVPGVGNHPLAVFTSDGWQPPVAAADLNNLFDATGVNAELTAGDVIQIAEYRGLSCPGLAGHRSIRYRRVPDHEEVATLAYPLTQLEQPDACFFADTLCDDTIDILDAQRVLTAFGSQPGDCAFNADLDIVADQVINILDVQSVLNRFGESAPFN